MQFRVYKGYKVYEDGTVISKRTDKPLVTPINDRGYKLVQIWDEGKLRTFTLHKLVSLVFHGETPSGLEVDHKDNNKLNNHINNLAFVSRSANIKKMWEHQGTSSISGFNSHCIKYSEDEFKEVLALIQQGTPNREILTRTRIKRGTLIKLRNGTHFYAKQQQ